MSVDIRSSDRRRYMNEIQAREKEIAAGLLKVSQPASPKALQENEKRIRREIANSNERRRMQCINAGFSSLRALIPQLEGEKLSKAAILQHTTDYITNMEKEKSRLQMQLEHHKRLLAELGQDRVVTDAYVSSSPPPSKRKKRDTESSDEGVGSLSDASDEGGSDLRHENMTLRHQLEAETQRCAVLEERNRLLESQLLSVLQVQAAHPGTLNELRAPVGLEHQPRHETIYNREVVEVIASHEGRVPPSPRGDNFQPPRPLSPTPERGMAMETSNPIDATTTSRGSSGNDSSCYTMTEPQSPPMKAENYVIRETSTPSTIISRVPSEEPMSASPTTATTTSTASPTGTDQHNYHHHHNYCHRDHPRRRHRMQAQAARVEEELRRQQQQQQQQQDMNLSTTPVLYQPKHNTQNLEKLVEAIRQIEGDRMLCDDRKLYEEEQKLYDKRLSVTNVEECERETSSVSDQDELKSEGSGRDSPLQHHRHHPHHHSPPQQQPTIINSHQLTTSLLTSNTPSTSISNSSSSFSEKFPVATHLLHRPLQPCYYRPGVIVHKQ